MLRSKATDRQSRIKHIGQLAHFHELMRNANTEEGRKALRDAYYGHDSQVPSGPSLKGGVHEQEEPESMISKYELEKPENFDAYKQGMEKVKQLEAEGKRQEAEELVTELRNGTQEYFNSSVRRLFETTSKSKDVESLKQELRGLKERGKSTDAKFIFDFGERVERALTVAVKPVPEAPAVDAAKPEVKTGEEAPVEEVVQPVAVEPVVQEPIVVEPVERKQPGNDAKEQPVVEQYGYGAGNFDAMFASLNIEMIKSNSSMFKVLADERKRNGIMLDKEYESLLAWSDPKYAVENVNELKQQDPVIMVCGIETLRKKYTDEAIGKAVFGEKEFTKKKKEAFYGNEKRSFGFRFLWNELRNTSEYVEFSTIALENIMKGKVGNGITLSDIKTKGEELRRGLQQQYGGSPPVFERISDNELEIRFRNENYTVKKDDSTVPYLLAREYWSEVNENLGITEESIKNDDIRHRIEKDVFIQLIEFNEGETRQNIVRVLLMLGWVKEDKTFMQQLSGYEPELIAMSEFEGRYINSGISKLDILPHIVQTIQNVESDVLKNCLLNMIQNIRAWGCTPELSNNIVAEVVTVNEVTNDTVLKINTSHVEDFIKNGTIIHELMHVAYKTSYFDDDIIQQIETILISDIKNIFSIQDNLERFFQFVMTTALDDDVKISESVYYNYIFNIAKREGLIPEKMITTLEEVFVGGEHKNKEELFCEAARAFAVDKSLFENMRSLLPNFVSRTEELFQRS